MDHSKFHKENLPPQTNRQGKGFKLKLGLTDGPFLPQDLMHSNPRSLNLLAAKEILSSQISMSKLMADIEKN